MLGSVIRRSATQRSARRGTFRLSRTGRVRAASAVVAAMAAVALVTTGAPARAAGPNDQITGSGQTDSALTVSWAQGILGADNKTVVKPRDPASPLSFMYPDFQNLKVTVSQTTNLVHQSLLVTWTGGKSTVGGGNFQGDFLQMMQCYGDANTGPDPEGCEFGSTGILHDGVVNPGIGSRGGPICVKGAVPSPENPPMTADGSVPNNGCDTQEPADLSHIDPGPGASNTFYDIPFVPVTDPTRKVYNATTEFYDSVNTNEVQEASTDTDGTGHQLFQTLTSIESPGLGCGALEANGQTRNCWLVIVPRGEFKPNGWHINTNLVNGAPNFVTDSPLGASNWAQRIQIHLGFDPLKPNCPIGSVKERQTVGTQLIARAVFSWQLALNQAADCKTVYGYAKTPEPTDTTQLSDTSGGSAGLAFTTIPIGSEASRINGGGPPPKVPPLVYAPVAASALTFGVNINLASGFQSTPIKLTPRLVAKALTQSYKQDLPDFAPSMGANGPEWAKNNSLSILTDPEFRKLNPQVVGSTGSGNPIAPLLTADASAINQQVWAWVDADASARKWLSGTPDENGMVINPEYQTLRLDKAPIDSYPRADSTSFSLGTDNSQTPPKDEIRNSLDLLPYVNDFEDAAGRVATGNNPEGAAWDNTKLAPDGTTGFWGNGGPEPARSTFMWGITDSSNLASFGAIPADLCDASGANCVSPDTATVTAALNGAKPDSTGLLHIDPAKPGANAYPLVDVTYAAVRATLDPAALVDYATLIVFAAGAGQTPGVLPGQLPPGYLPLPEKLKSQAAAGAVVLLALAVAQTSPTPRPTTRTTTPPAGSTGAGGGGGTTGGATPTATVSPPGSALTPTPSPGPETISQGPTTPAAKSTPQTPIGAVRWVLLTVMIVGLVGAIGTPVIRVALGRRS